MEYTQIIATISPNSGKRARMRAMIESGLDVVRINFSHGTYDEYVQIIETARGVGDEVGRIIPIIGDLCGPKIRTGEVVDDHIVLEEGKEIFLTTEKIAGTPERMTVTYDNLLADVQVGHRILLNDGCQELRVEEIVSDGVRCVIIHGGEIRSRRGVNLPDTHTTIPAITEKDMRDIDFAVGQKLEYLALSFVRDAADIRALRNILREKEHQPKIIAKIETPQAVESIESIIEEADSIMIARGDLALEIGFERVPVIQREIIQMGHRFHKNIIVATQMMQSMVSSPVPTRAEVSDVANAVLDGVDAVMLSDETAVGLHPELTVLYMQRIVDEVEKSRSRTESIKL